MARYRVKDQTDLDWNKIRRRITREVDIQIADAREEILNKLLGDAFKKYSAAIERGDKPLVIEATYETFVGKAIRDSVDVPIDAAR